MSQIPPKAYEKFLESVDVKMNHDKPQEIVIINDPSKNNGLPYVSWRYNGVPDGGYVAKEAVKVLRAGHNAIISAKKSGCVEYKGCECWHQNASLALSKADAILGQGDK